MVDFGMCADSARQFWKLHPSSDSSETTFTPPLTFPGTEASEQDNSRSRGSSLDDQDEYIEIRQGGDISSGETSEDEDGYLHMSPAPTMYVLNWNLTAILL